jgi:CHAD domain-containing protein
VAEKSLEKQIRAASGNLQVDWDHARHVAKLSKKLFEATRHVSGLTKTARPAVEACALLQGALTDLAAQEAPDPQALLEKIDMPEAYRQVAGEAIRLARPQTEVSATIRSMSQETGSVGREAAIRLAALLRLTEGLDHSRTQTTDIEGIHDSGREIRILTRGNASPQDAASAQARANLWNDLLGRPVQIVCSSTVSSTYIPVIDAREPMCNALRRILQLHAEQLWSRQYGAAWEQDEEFVHEMRVACRRIRTALELSRDVLGAQADYWAQEFNWLGDLLGSVRDLDVLMDFLDEYIDEAPKTHRKALEEMTDTFLRRRKSASRRLIKGMESPRYEKLRQGFGRSITQPVGSLEGLQAVGDRAEEPFGQEAHALSALQLAALTHCSQDLESLESEPLHQVRLACKKLRYTLEFFQDVLPEDAAEIAEKTSCLQDLLGEVHDADVWSRTIEKYARKSDDDATGRMCKALLRTLDRRRGETLQEAQRAWGRFTRPSAMQQWLQSLGGQAWTS